MKAIIIYDNFVFAETAKLMLRLASYQANAVMHWNIRPWRVDALSLIHNADEALADATDAHLILFAGHRTQSLPSWLLDWLERWVACRQIKDAAFAVIGSGNRPVLSMPTTPELAHFAEKHGLGFILDDDLVVSRETEYSKNEPSFSPQQSRFMDAPIRDWGINE
jgi:hypothetical protein